MFTDRNNWTNLLLFRNLKISSYITKQYTYFLRKCIKILKFGSNFVDNIGLAWRLGRDFNSRKLVNTGLFKLYSTRRVELFNAAFFPLVYNSAIQGGGFSKVGILSCSELFYFN